MLCRNAVDWLYRLDRTFTWESGLVVPHDLAFRDKQGVIRLVIETSGRITVMRGYAWNGCSPKFCVLDILIGTPDGVVHAGTGKPKAYYASLVHDALYQFLPVAAPVTRRDADRCFLRLLAASDFKPRYVYWLAVRVLGWVVRLGKQRVRQWEGAREAL